MDTNTDNIILHNITPDQLKAMLKELIKEEMDHLFCEVQKVMGEDDLISTGTAARLLGICNKVFRVLVQEKHFTVYLHMKERRYSRAEILAYRNQYRARKRKSLR